MARFLKKGSMAALALLFLLLLSGGARADQFQFGYTVNRAAVYDASVTPHKKTGKSIPAYTVLRFAGYASNFVRLEDGSALRTSDVALYSYLGAAGKTVYWDKAQTLYATGNTNHPLKTKLPSRTPVKTLRLLGGYYLIKWKGVYGFAPIKTAKAMPEAEEGTPVYTVLNAKTVFYDLPVAGVRSSFRLTREQGVILRVRVGAFYAFEQKGRTYYLPQSSVKNAKEAARSPHAEGYAERAVPLLDLPDDARGKVVGKVPKGTVCTLSYGINGYVQVTYGPITGFAKKSAFLYPGGDKQRYYLFVNKATRELIVYQADPNGAKTDKEVLRVVIAIGRVTSPTPSGIFTLGSRERWRSFTLSYAPYAIAYAQNLFIHGPLYFQQSESTIVSSRLSDFGQMATGGCLRTPYEQVQWIYFHCAEGTTLEIVNGVQAAKEAAEATQAP